MSGVDRPNTCVYPQDGEIELRPRCARHRVSHMEEAGMVRGNTRETTVRGMVENTKEN